MKFLFICLLLMVVAYCSLGQEARKAKKPETREEFLSKSKGQRTAAWILLGVGVVGIAAVAPGNSDFGTTGTVVVLSGIAILSSIPLFISARKNKKRGLARPISLNIENMSKPFFTHARFHPPALSLKVSLNRNFIK